MLLGGDVVRSSAPDAAADGALDDAHDLSVQHFAWLLLAQLWRLLRNIQAGRVFEEENVHILRAVSWCCAGAGLVCLGSTFWYLPFAAVAVAACFMALIVRIVKNVFQQALAMKSELDLTI